MKNILSIFVLSLFFIGANAQNAPMTQGDSLLMLCKDEIKANRLAEALTHGLQAIDMLEPLDDGMDQAVAQQYRTATALVTSVYNKSKDFEETARIKEREKAHEAKVYGTDSRRYEILLQSLSLLYGLTDNHEAKLAINLEQLDHHEKTYGKESLEYASILDELAYAYSSLEKHEEALKCIHSAVKIIEAKQGTDSPEYADILSSQASITMHAGKYGEAKSIASKALTLKEKLLDAASPDYIKQLYEIAKGYERYEQYADAIRIIELVLAASKEKDSDYAKALETLANYKYEANEFTECIDLIKEALSIRESKKDERYARCLKQLSTIEHKLGHYTEAIDIDEKALDIWRSLDSDLAQRWQIAALHSLASTYSSLGNKRKSAMLTKEAMLLDKELNGTQLPDIAWKDVENDISGGEDLIYTREGQDYMLQITNEDLEYLQSRDMMRTTDYADDLITLAHVYTCMKDFSTALEKAEQAKDIQREVIGQDNGDYILTLQMIARCQWSLGNHDEARKCLHETLSIAKKLYPANHPDILSLMTDIAITEADGNSTDAIKYAIDATYGLRTMVKNSFARLTAIERNLYWEKYKQWFQLYLPYIAQTFPNDEMTCTVYDGMLLSKGLLLNTEIEMGKLIEESGDKDMLNKYYTLCVARAEMNALTDDDQAKAISLEKTIEETEKDLLKHCTAYGDYTKNLSIQWENVKKSLKDNEIAIELVEIKDVKEDNSTYVALILRKEDKRPIWVKLFDKKALNAIRSNNYYTTPQLSELVWKPLSEYLSSKETVYIAPAGDLYNIGIEHLPQWDGNGLVADKWKILRVSSTRQLVHRAGRNQDVQAVIYGGIQYDADTTSMANESRKYPRSRSLDDFIVVDDSVQRSGIQNLPATKTEAENIDRVLKSVHIQDSLYLGVHGSEASFKALSGKKMSLLHIATHGFYWPEKTAQNMSHLNFLQSGLQQQQQEDKALSRSGLLFAGASNAWMKKSLPKDAEDGILTAKEISRLDLRGLDLVILSACQTGIGEIAGDGVFGLQRGFKKAGANTLMMSLWKVDDNATQMLMTRFYENLFLKKNTETGKPFTKSEALKDAQKYVREFEKEVTVSNAAPAGMELIKEMQTGNQQKESKIIRPYKDPKYWAAFILLDALE